MNWHRKPLRQVAPPVPSQVHFAPGETVWHLNLDQIESHTGRILEKKFATASQAGSSTYLFDTGNVLYSKLRPYLNKVVRPDGPGIATTELVPLRPIPGVLDPDFLAYYLRSPEFLSFAQYCVAGVKMPRVMMSQLWEALIPVPPLSEQRWIVDVLDRADDLRRKRSEADTISERILPALFIKTFGSPVDSTKGWTTQELGSLIKDGPQNGLYKPASEYGSGTPILRIDSFYDGRLVRDCPLKRLRLDDGEILTYALRPNDIVINRVNSPEFLGKSMLVEDPKETMVFESNMMRLSVDTSSVRPIYVIHLLQTTAAKAFLLRRSKRAVNQASINQQDVRALPVPLPPLELQREFERRCKGIEDLLLKQRHSTNVVDDLFAILVHRAFSGALTARWRDARIKDLLVEMEIQVRLLGLGETANFTPS